MKTLPSILFAFLTLLIVRVTTAQSIPISIDSRFDDWTEEAVSWNDPAGDGTQIDLLGFDVANDEDFLFLRLETAQEINLTESNKITLYIDTDNQLSTGLAFNGIGADLRVHIGEKEAVFQSGNSSTWYSLNEITFRHQPTVSSEVFEIAISRETVSFSGVSFFPGTTIKLAWEDGAGSDGDRMPDEGIVFSYNFDETLLPPLPAVPLEKDQQHHVRLLTWNTLNTGLDDIDRAPYFKRVLGVLQPDIVTFNECWDMEASQAASFMNAAAPIGNFQSWQAVKLDQGNITVSRYPIVQNWLIFPGHRLTASLIDLPDDTFSKDILVVNAHFKCCGNGDYDRQREADAFINFLLDAKSPGGHIDLPEGTPFILSGDLNLVGDRQQLNTLLTGEIINTGQFGPGAFPDWDNTGLLDVIALQTGERMAFTWENKYSDYPPSRLDFHILSNSVLQVEKAYTLHTGIMSDDQLAAYGLGRYDTEYASDHLPKVTDLSYEVTTATRQQTDPPVSLIAYPNPASDMTKVRFDYNRPTPFTCLLQNPTGQTVRKWTTPAGQTEVNIDWSGLPAGMYYFLVRSEDQVNGIKLIHDE